MQEENDTVDWSQPDWSRERPRQFWDPARKLLKTIRDYHALKGSKNPINLVRLKLCVLRHRFWSAVSGAEIDLTCTIEGGLLLPHPNGIVIHPGSKIGPNCLIFQQVTLAGPVNLGHHVDVGAGAKLMGPLTVGNNVRIGSNSVVTKDVGDGLTVAGVPAKPLG
jgi:serine O-acetyltransferase